jgi:glycosyltransferase involved in cell wall biosynthesis
VKIIQIATSTEGGAGIAARRLNSTLNSFGEDSTLISGSSTKLSSGNKEIVVEKNFFVQLFSKIVTICQRIFVQKTFYLMTPYSMKSISVGRILNEKPDVIHIHTFYNLLDNQAISDLCRSGKPIFITLHDERFYTGGCHHALDCSNFQHNCVSCPQSRTLFEPLVAHQQKKLSETLRECKSLTIIAPSNWIATRVQASKGLRFAQVIQINNPLELEFIAGSEPRKRLKKLAESYLVTFVAQDLYNPYKGLDTLLECIKIYEREFISNDIQFMFVGKGSEIDIQSLKYKQIDKLPSSEMIQIYFESDLLIVPSLADNSPNVIFEALACGTPFVGSDRAGIPEISQIFQMETFAYGDPSSMFRAIIKQKNAEHDQEWIRATTLDLVHPHKVAARLMDVYKSKLTEAF